MEANLPGQEPSVISAIIFGILLLLLMAGLLILFFFLSRKKIIQKELEKKDMLIEHQKHLLHATIITQEEERKRIARDLHDDISAKLNIVSLNSHLLNDKINQEEKQEVITNIITMTAKALENSRRIAHDLLPPVLEKFGLKAGIEELCDEFATAKNTKVTLSIDADFDKLDEIEGLNLFRILQELMNNSLRHGKATLIDLKFSNDGSRIKLNYLDNGEGFDMKILANKAGLGMKNIESRVELLKGTIKFESETGKGVKVLLLI
ncbi:sensor histidine kinase [Ascidiimonas sp. W6]|uniref:sensor histidine kinase n=1 Tax=Ascidiimonas meishanensis TaxID=3128903 RepID=UPI0030EDA4BB